MRKNISCIVVFLIFHFSLFASTAVQGSLEYHVAMPQPHTHYFEVQIHVKNYGNEQADFKLPVWTPGSYLIREYPKNVEGFSASGATNRTDLPFHKINKNTWRVQNDGVTDFVISYSVYAFEGSVRMSYLDESHAFIMANTLLMYHDEFKEKSAVLHLDIPEQWNRVSTSLSKIQGKESTYYIPVYDILVDSPIEIGNHEIMQFEAAGVPHEIAMYGRAVYNPDKLIRDISNIVETATNIFGDNPNEKYVFIIHNTGSRSGGLEHLSSTVLGVNRHSYTNDYRYGNFLSLVAHEYLHLWLVKRLKPVELELINYDEEMYTDLLWVMEGLTSYFEEKVMLKSGFHDVNQFLNNIVSTMASIRNLPGARVQSVAEASFDAWIKFYRKSENSSNTQVSYYSKGMLLGALLDLEIIKGSSGEHTLDDAVKQLYDEFHKKMGKGITSDDLKKTAENLGKISLDDFFDSYIYGTEYLDNEKYLHYAGIALVETNGEVNGRTIGVSVSQKDAGLIIGSISRGSSAYDNGLNVGDELIAIDEYRLTASNLQSLLSKYKVNDQVKMLIGRDGLIYEKEIEIRRDDSVIYTYEFLDNKTKAQERVLSKWLGQ
jgi:predicted metalloprotease with PDZ domain